MAPRTLRSNDGRIGDGDQQRHQQRQRLDQRQQGLADAPVAKKAAITQPPSPGPAYKHLVHSAIVSLARLIGLVW